MGRGSLELFQGADVDSVRGSLRRACFHDNGTPEWLLTATTKPEQKCSRSVSNFIESGRYVGQVCQLYDLGSGCKVDPQVHIYSLPLGPLHRGARGGDGG